MNLLDKIAASAGSPSLARDNARTWNKYLVRVDNQRFSVAVPVLPVH
ncbi:hypothetical protein [Polaromonas naphthalenivorans]|nr:hypothetical protein [Polaromonas naphthalenivorans]